MAHLHNENGTAQGADPGVVNAAVDPQSPRHLLTRLRASHATIRCRLRPASHSEQVVALTTRDKLPAAYPDRATVQAGGLMSYGADGVDMYRHAGVYTGNILKGAKPADLPVQQSTKFEFVINRETPRHSSWRFLLRVFADLID